MERWVEEIEGWDDRPFSGGYAGLHDLADDSFSGAVSAGSTWLLFVNGRIVSVGEYRQTAAGDEFEPGEPGPNGDIERFEAAEGTVYEAPHPAVPLVVAMQLADGESRGRYYTENTPLSEVQKTLSDGGFTGYLELSENVLSGDYYTVYQAGRSMDIAFVGNARRLKTDEEARELARDEVGIYEVIAADLDVTEIPEHGAGATAGASGGAGAAGAAGGAGAAGAATAGGSGAGTPTPDEDDEPTDLSSSGAPENPVSSGDANGQNATADVGAADVSGDESAGTASDDPLATDPDPDESARAAADDPEDTVDDRDTEAAGADPREQTTSASDTDAVSESSSETGREPEPETAPRSEPTVESGAGPDRASDGTDSSATDVTTEPEAVGKSATGGGGSTPDRASEPASSDASAAATPTEQLASRSVPSLDPDRTDSGDGARAAGGRRDRPSERDGDDRSESRASADAGATASDGARSGAAATGAGELTSLREEVEVLQQSLRTVEAERDEAEAELAELESELDQVTTERNELIDERDELEAEADRLRARVAELEEQVDLPGNGPSLSEAEALSGTNLFVRYESKGLTTVEDIHDGDGSPDDLAENLRISAHTQFESEDAHVAGEPFAEWLHGSQRYRFVEWLVSQLVFEIRDTDSAGSMRDLYDALPRIDRIDFDAAVSVEADDAGEVTFDIVCRDRMGDPLVVANLDAAREPVEEAEMAELVKDAVAVCRGKESFAAAFYVTAAFFESPALETARDATSGSLLSRDSRRSYVKESRKRGFHLGLVESRDGAFHLSVPDL